MSGNGCRLETDPECDAGGDMLDALEEGNYTLILATSTRSNQADVATTAEEAHAADLDSYGQAAEQLGFPYIDLTDEFFRDDRCPAVIGNVIVYRDSPYSHTTATFSRTLMAAVEEQLVPIVAEAAIPGPTSTSASASGQRAAALPQGCS